MNDGLSPQVREAIISRLSENPRVERIVLFGSRATGSFSSASDVDLALYGPDLNLTDLAQLSQAMDDLPVPHRVDLVIFERIESEAIKGEIQTRGVEWSPQPVRTPEKMGEKGGAGNPVPLVRIGELFEISSGLSKSSDQFGFGTPFFTFKDVFYNHYLPECPSALVNATQRDIENGSISRGDVLITRTSETVDELGMTSVALADYPSTTFNGFTKRLRPKVQDRLSPEYLAYAFRTPGFRSQMYSLSSISTRASLNNEMLSRLRIPLPDFETQEAIGRILHTLDKRIELNRRMAATLEEMARAIFKSWFIDFDPVRAKAEGRPTNLPPQVDSLFPDSLEDSELGPIPGGWRTGSIAELATVGGGSTPSTKIPEFWDGEFAWATPKDLSKLSHPVLLETERSITEAGLKSISSGLYRPGTVLMSSRAPIGYLAITEIPVAVNQGFIALQSSVESGNLFLLRWLESNMDAIHGRANGSTFMEISKSAFRSIKTVLPSNDIVAAFGTLIHPLHLRLVGATRDSLSLKALRDALLPKLISGEIRVGGD